MNNITLKSSVAQLEDAIITISGPALAVSGIIAGVDLVTGGNILRSIWWLSLVWAITLLLTLDFQVLALGVRAHRVYASNKGGWRKFAEIALAFIIAASISYVSIQMQSIIARVNAEGIGIDQAAMQLGINTIWLIWERSSLVLVLIFISGWLREHDEEQEQPAPSISEDAMQVILAKLAKLDTLEQTIIEVTQPQLPAIQQPMLEAHREPETGFSTQSTNEPEKPETGFGDAIETLLLQEPGLDPQSVASRVGCSITTARKWMKRLEVAS